MERLHTSIRVARVRSDGQITHRAVRFGSEPNHFIFICGRVCFVFCVIRDVINIPFAKNNCIIGGYVFAETFDGAILRGPCCCRRTVTWYVPILARIVLVEVQHSITPQQIKTPGRPRKRGPIFSRRRITPTQCPSGRLTLLFRRNRLRTRSRGTFSIFRYNGEFHGPTRTWKHDML